MIHEPAVYWSSFFVIKGVLCRQLVTNEAVHCSLDQAFSRWGMQLVMVADQESRRTALCGLSGNPSWEFSLNEYCILERIGRSRHHGEITQGEHGLKQVNQDNKMLFYYRSVLFHIFSILTLWFFFLNIIIRLAPLVCISKIKYLYCFDWWI